MSAPAKASDLSVCRVLWTRFVWRHWRREWRLTLLLTGVLALGVAVFLSVRLANKAAVTGFSLFTESLAGESDFLLRPPSGRLDGGVLRDLRAASGTLPLAYFPVLEVSAAEGGAAPGEGRPVRLVGADLVALRNLGAEGGTADPLGGGAGAEAGEGFRLGAADLGYIGESRAARLGLAEGDRMTLHLGGGEAELEIAGILPDLPGRPAVPDNLVLMDLPGLRELAGEPGALSRVEVRVPSGAMASRVREEAAARLGAFARERGLVLETPEDRRESVTRMSAAFRLNLSILSGLALLVGTYLILQAMEAAVVRRRGEIAVLRSLGVSPGQIRRAWLWESLVLGAAGSAAGVLLGRLLATAIVGAVSRTVNTLYYETTTAALTLGWGEVAFCMAFGTGASLAAGFVPAREAAATPPAQAMRQGAAGGGLALLRNGPLGAALVAAAALCALLPPAGGGEGGAGGIPLGGYAAAALGVVGASILTGFLLRPLALLMKGSGGSPARRYAASQLAMPRGRHRLTAAGLCAAAGMSAAMAVLVASFEHTLTSWIDHLLRADLYISATGAGSAAHEAAVSEEVWRRLESWPGVAGLDKMRRHRIEFGGEPAFLGGADYHPSPGREVGMLWLAAPEDAGSGALRRVPPGGAVPVWVSEGFARRTGLGVGAGLSLPVPTGEMPARVEGVYADYGSETGTVLAAREFTAEWFGDGSVSQIALYAADGVDSAELEEQLSAAFPALAVRGNARLREESLRIFRQTFAVTYALEAIAVLIAVAGLGMALAGLLLDRRDELATLRALGMGRREIAAAAAWEGAGLAAAGLAGGVAASFGLGWILIRVINPQSFGWTLLYRVPWASLALLVAAGLAAGAAVAWFTGLRGAKLRSQRRE